MCLFVCLFILRKLSVEQLIFVYLTNTQSVPSELSSHKSREQGRIWDFCFGADPYCIAQAGFKLKILQLCQPPACLNCVSTPNWHTFFFFFFGVKLNSIMSFVSLCHSQQTPPHPLLKQTFKKLKVATFNLFL